jgi:hypothetical protein
MFSTAYALTGSIIFTVEEPRVGVKLFMLFTMLFWLTIVKDWETEVVKIPLTDMD